MKSTLTYLLLFLSCFALNAQTTGKAFLDGQTVHDGILVRFNPVSLAGQADSTVTDSTGTFDISLQPGVYEVDFRKSGYQSIFYLNGAPQFLAGSDTLLDVNLPIGIFKQVSGTVSGTFFADTIYLATGDLFVPNGQKLTVEPGTMVMFSGDHQLLVEGSIVALGQPFLPITFGPNPYVGNTLWQGILVNNSTNLTVPDTAQFSHTLIDRADVAIEVVQYGSGGLKTYVGVNNSVIRHSAGIGIALTGHLEVQILENQIYGFGTAGISHATFQSGSIDIECNEVHSSSGAGIYSYNSAGLVYVAGNYVHDLTGGFSYGIRPRKTGGDFLVENNLIVNCDAGIAESRNFAGAPPTVIQNNVIYNSSLGISLSGLGGAIIRMNAILESNFGIVQNSPQYGTPQSVTYNAFFNNNIDVDGVQIPGLGTPVILNNQGDSSDVWYNLYADPLIGAPNVWYPASSSPLIDAGDPSAPLDTNGTLADIGLRNDFIDCLNLPELGTRLVTSSTRPLDMPLAVSVYPNPSQGRFKIASPAEVVSVELYGLDGRQIPLRNLNNLEFQVEQFSAGLYFVRVRTLEGMATERLLLK